MSVGGGIGGMVFPGGDPTLGGGTEGYMNFAGAPLEGGLMLGGRAEAPRTFRVVSFDGKAVGKEYDSRYYMGAKPDSAARKAARKFFKLGDDAVAGKKDSGVMSVTVVIKETTRGASTYANGQDKTFSYRVTRSRAAKKDIVKDANGKVIQRVWDYSVKSLR
jgi:hypothetical protein